MRNKFFKFNENYAKVIKHLDDRQAGQYVRAISDYAFEGKTYGGKDTAVKTAFTLTKQMIDDEKFYREKGRLGGQKIAERKRTEDGQTESDTVLKSVIETVVASELLSSLLGGQGEKHPLRYPSRPRRRLHRLDSLRADRQRTARINRPLS